MIITLTRWDLKKVSVTWLNHSYVIKTLSKLFCRRWTCCLLPFGGAGEDMSGDEETAGSYYAEKLSLLLFRCSMVLNKSKRLWLNSVAAPKNEHNSYHRQKTWQQTVTAADGTVKNLTTPPSDVLKYTLADGSWIAVRPSGTEPKSSSYTARGNQRRITS